MKKKKARRRGEWNIQFRMVDENEYPDLENNPSNPFNAMRIKGTGYKGDRLSLMRNSLHSICGEVVD